MNDARSLLAAAAVLLAMVQGCGWFDDVERAPDERLVNSMVPSDGGDDTTDEDVRADGGFGSDPTAGEGGGGAGGTSSGGTGAGAGGTSGDPTAGSGGESGAAGDSPDPPVDGGCELDCEPPDPLIGDFTWHPEPRRFAVTDESADMYEQARVWLVANGGNTPHRLLVNRLSKLSDAWLDTGIAGVTSGVAGVSFTDDGVHYERVFFMRDGRLHMLTADPSAPPDGAVPAESFPTEPLVHIDGATFVGGNLAAVAFKAAGGSRRIAVLAQASMDDTPGRYCVFELDIAEGASSASCIDAPPAHEHTDVASVAVGDEVHFYLRSAANGLVRIVRTLAGVYEASALNAPEGTLAQSLAAVPSPIDGRIELFAITEQGTLWNARPLAAERTSPEWSELPRLPTGVLVSAGPAAVAAITTDNFGPLMQGGPSVDFKVTELRVIGADGLLYHTSNDAADAQHRWRSTWYRVPDPGRDQRVLAIGGITKYPLFSYEAANALCVVGGDRASTLQESPTLFVEIYWRDRIRIQQPVALPSDAPLAALSSASGPDHVLIAAEQRLAQGPAKTLLFSSIDGAGSYRALVVRPSDPNDSELSIVQPTVRYGGGAFHFTALEQALAPDCGASPAQLGQITYRYGDDARRLAEPKTGESNTFVVGAGQADVRDPVLAVTEGAPGATAHVLYRAGAERDWFYWRRSPDGSGAVSAAITRDMPDGPPVIATGSDETVYAAAFDQERFEVCQIPVDGDVPVEACSALPFASPAALEIPFGASHPERQGACSDPTHKCFRDERPISLAVDASPLVPTKHRLVVAYAAHDGIGTSIYLTRSRGGLSISGNDASELQGWSPPIRINARPQGDTRHYFDAEVTIDSVRNVTVTYSAISSSPKAGQRAQSYVARGTMGWGEGALSEFQIIGAGTWEPDALPFDCATQRWALGDYREPETVGARTLQVLRTRDGHDSRWLSEFVAP